MAVLNIDCENDFELMHVIAKHLIFDKKDAELRKIMSTKDEIGA